MNNSQEGTFTYTFGEFVHLHMQYCSFVNSILKHLTFPFLTPARKPTVNFYFTFTVTIAFFFPALTVIFAVPAFLAFTTPFAFYSSYFFIAAGKCYFIGSGDRLKLCFDFIALLFFKVIFFCPL